MATRRDDDLHVEELELRRKVGRSRIVCAAIAAMSRGELEGMPDLKEAVQDFADTLRAIRPGDPLEVPHVRSGDPERRRDC